MFGAGTGEFSCTRGASRCCGALAGLVECPKTAAGAAECFGASTGTAAGAE